MKEKTFVGSKIIVFILSFVYMLNGLGLIVAGIRSKTKRWVIAGIVYIFGEWVCLLIGVDFLMVASAIISLGCVIHTVLILSSYGDKLAERNRTATVSKCEEVRVKNDDINSVNEVTPNVLQDIILPIGNATVEYIDGKTKIIIKSKNDYEFISDGRFIDEARVNNTFCKYE